MRRSWFSKSSISSWTSWVWLTTRLRLVANSLIEPGPPTSSQESGLMVEVISSMRLSKSAIAAPPSPPGPKPTGPEVIPPPAVPGPDICANTAGLIMPEFGCPFLLATTDNGEEYIPIGYPPPNPMFPMALFRAASNP